MSDIRKELDALASAVAKEATKAQSLSEMVEALDSLTKYYAVTLKKQGKGDDADDDETNFGAFSGQISGADNANGRTQPPSSRRRSS